MHIETNSNRKIQIEAQTDTDKYAEG